MRWIFRVYFVVFIIVFSTLLTGCSESRESGFQEISADELDEEGVSSEDNTTEKIFVHVCGEVKNPGVYELDAGSRVYEALEAAGGLTKNAADDSINQAELLNDGQKLEVVSKQEQKSQNDGTGMTDVGKVNINEASKEELMTLSGIGEAKADAIIRYRETNGHFQSIEEIMEIEGIKEGVFRKIEEKITTS